MTALAYADDPGALEVDVGPGPEPATVEVRIRGEISYAARTRCTKHCSPP